VTGPVSAQQLLTLAEGQLRQLAVNTKARPEQLAAAWPAFLRAGEHLLARIAAQPGDPGRGRAATGDEREEATPAADPQLVRAATLLAAAGDLVAGRDRSELSAEQRAVDAAHAAVPLLAGAGLVAAATLPHRELLAVTASAVTAAHTWSATGFTAASEEQIAAVPPAVSAADTAADTAAVTVTFDDASTALSRPTSSQTEDLAGLATAAVHGWQHAAEQAMQRAAPSSRDLRIAALAAGQLLALTQVLIRVHPPIRGTLAGVDGCIQQIRLAGSSWNAAADAWRSFTTGTAPSEPLLQATAVLDDTVSALARTAGGWASPEQIRDRISPDAAHELARGALAAIARIADQHSAQVSRLAHTGAVYAPARQLTATAERIPAVLRGRWLPATAAECALISTAYQHLPESTAAARFAHTALSDPTRRVTAAMPTSAAALTPPAATPTRARATTVAEQRWQPTCSALDPRLPTDPHFRVLAAALDRVTLSGTDAAAALTQAVDQGPLPPEHTARTLHHRLLDSCPAARIPWVWAPPAALPPSRPTPPSLAPARKQPAPSTPRR
jgi:hypothetical protein